ncbi:MAG: serine protease [Acidimicrobiia bacterium]|nr:serine protease [Acidimicrobiia bacterium]
MSRRTRAAVPACLLSGLLVLACASSGGEGRAAGKDATQPGESTQLTRNDVTTLDVVSPADAGKPGDTTADENIVGGFTITAFPWIAALVPPGASDNFCGGVLIRSNLVMTAAHCVTDKEDLAIYGPGTFEVVLGRSDLTQAGGEVLGVKAVYVSALWDWAGQWDFAMVELDQPSSATPVALPLASDETLWATGEQLIVAGWGCQWPLAEGRQTCEQAGGSPLKATLTSVLPADTCAQHYSTFSAETMLCATDERATSTTCQGDSGGPFVTEGSDDRLFLVGLVSFGPVGCPPGVPEMAAFVPAVLDTARPAIDPDSEWWPCQVPSCTVPPGASPADEDSSGDTR